MTDSLELLLDADQPEPSLLGWLAARCAVTDLSAVAQVAASAGEMAPHTGWPVISEAVHEVYAARMASREDLFFSLSEAPVSLATGLHRLGAPPDTPLHDLTNQEVAYLLPFLPGSDSADARWRSVMAIEEAARAEASWYATALAARVVPHLDDGSRSRIAALAGRLDTRWGTRLAQLARVRTPWPSVAAELEASHPSFPRAGDIAAALDDSVVMEVCHRTIARLAERYRAVGASWLPPLPLPPEDIDTTRAESDQSSGAPELPGLLGDDAPSRWSRYANTGVSQVAWPEAPLDRDRCLEPDAPYLFWFEVAEGVAEGSIERNPEPVHLPTGVLTVALFSFPGHIEILDGQDIGQLELKRDGQLEVLSRPAGSPSVGTRLFFPIRTPARPGRYRLRCHLYYRQTLLQSRLVEMQVEPAAPVRAHALTAQIDYTSGIAPDPRDLADVRPLTLSVFVNDNGDGTHSFRFLGAEGEVKTQAVLDERQLENIIEETRGALRKASWGSTDPESSGPHFRYDGNVPSDYDQDLIDLACKGYRLWTAIGGEFAETASTKADTTAPILQLAARLRKPGVIEIASKDHAGIVVPAALFYDHPLDWGNSEGVHLCEESNYVLQTGNDLADSPCFRGDCPSYADDSVVCPSGFWGYRHEIGLPQSTAPVFEETPWAPAHGGHCIRYTDRPRCVVGISEDLAGPHTEHVRSLYLGTILARRQDLLDHLRESSVPQLLYFFCHGEVINGNPMLRVGDNATAPIPWDLIADGRMFWPDSRPLVFLNGCRTAAVEPHHAMSFVKAFVHRARASGLIGTEIITYESLAAEFADSVLHHFMKNRSSIAYAMRAARLALLSQQNPLGLIYVAYAPPHLRMRQA
ncbi:hypothetical protein [Streptomyces vastus]|uniref:CHAT domain-containing protein n=1 Tax=Streptomyces vastus TaxID=285451 RepID=A0ABN3R8D1_9ACTN